MKKLIFIILLLCSFVSNGQLTEYYKASYLQANSSPVSYDWVYEFLYNDNLNEETGTHPAININGTISYTNGPSAQLPRAGIFNGSFFYDLAASSEFSQTTDFTIVLVMYKTGDWSANWQEIVEHGRSVGSNANWYYVSINGDTANTLMFRWSNNGSNVGRLESTAFGTINTWYHVICTVNGTTARIYVDGVLDSEATGITLGSAVLDEIRHGAFQDGGEEYTGYLAANRLLDSGLSETEAFDLYDCDMNGNCN